MRPAALSRRRAPGRETSRANPTPASPPLRKRRTRIKNHPTRNPQNRPPTAFTNGASLNTRLNISMADDMSFNPTRDDFEALLNDSMGGRDFAEGTVVKGIVVGIEKDFAIIDVGLKTEGRVPQKEFGVDDAGKPTIKVGDHVEVFLERLENALGEAVISREKAKREEAWTRLEGVFAKQEPVMGSIVGRVKGGFTVDLGRLSAAAALSLIPSVIFFGAMRRNFVMGVAASGMKE